MGTFDPEVMQKSRGDDLEIRVTMTDGQIRQAISEWIAKHTEFSVTHFYGVKGKTGGGTVDFPDFVLGVKVKGK